MREVTMRETLAYSAACRTFLHSRPNAVDPRCFADRQHLLAQASNHSVGYGKANCEHVSSRVRQYESTEGYDLILVH